MRTRCRFALAVLITFSRLTLAQTPDRATVRGHVLDQSGAVIVGAQVRITNALTGSQRIAVTDPTGTFLLAGLPVAGEYSVSTTRPNFAEARLNGVVLLAGTTAQFDFALNVADAYAQVTVTGVLGEVRVDSPQLGIRVSGDEAAETPLLNRRITYLPLLNAANRPAINQGDVFMNQVLFTTNGSGRRQASFVVDGSTGNDSWGRQTAFSAVPLLAVQDMTVLTNAFSADYGANTGSVINIVTRTGGQKFHADLLELWRPNAASAALSGFTAATAPNGNSLTRDTLGQTALSLSGPLAHGGHTQFFAAAEYSRQDRGSPVTSPIAPGVFIGHYRGWLGFTRVDHQINNLHSLFFRGELDGFHDTNPNGIVGGNSLPTVGRIFRRRTYSESVGETAVLSPRVVSSVRLQFQLASPITQFDPVVNGTQYQVPISTGGTFTTGTSQSALLMNRQYQVSDSVSVQRARQQIKFGADILAANTGGNSKEFGGPIYLGQFIYNTCTQPLSVCESPAFLNNIANVRSYTQSFGIADYSVNDVLWSVFVQDDYRVRTDLTVNLGVRYEQQTFTDARKNFAPRAGFSYNMRGDGKTVVRGGFGIYYSQVVDNTAANWALTGPTGVFNYTATPGQIGFPASVAAAPLPVFPSGAAVPLRNLYVRAGDSVYLNQFFPTSTLSGYPDRLLNPYSEQWTFGIQRRVASNWVLSADYVGSHTLKINRPLDVDAPAPFIRTVPGQIRTAQAANCSRPYWVAWYSQRGLACNAATATNPQPPYAVITADVNNGYALYNALDANLTHSFGSRLSLLASYTWSHATDNVDPDVPGQNPNDANYTGRIEHGNAIFDQRHRFVLSGVYVALFQIHFGGVATLASGLPFNFTTGTNNSGDTGATADRPVINGAVVGRNTGRGRAIYEVSPFLERAFLLGSERLRVAVRAEAFNVFNHPNFAGYSGTYGNGATAGPGFGTPLTGITNQLPARSMQFAVKLSF